MRALKFIRGWECYVPNDIAGFDYDLADFLIKEGFAKPLIKGSENPANLIAGEYLKKIPKLNNEEKKICPICGKILKTISSLKTHKKKIHGIK